MRPPPPVRLVAVDDVRLEATISLKRELDTFYIKLLQFERAAADGPPMYEAANCRITFDWFEEMIEREDFRMLGVEVASLGELEAKLIKAEIAYSRQRGLTAGRDSLVLQDPAGNWLEITELRRAMS